MEVVARHEQRGVIAQMNGQGGNLVDRLAEAPELRIAQLSAADYTLEASGDSATAVAAQGRKGRHTPWLSIQHAA
ncbi:hypothetical protein [Micromonospora sediminicola]|uniref:hypothetical protein n=1 Tax=Micromonospora sediminicola TaxID=946078 RepID=UPI000B89EF8F|nr:hypothetical protein [Micromonospora sediminicola]